MLQMQTLVKRQDCAARKFRILEGLQMPENIPGHHQVAIIRMQKSHPLRSCCSLNQSQGSGISHFPVI